MQKNIIRISIFCLFFIIGTILALFCYKEEYFTTFQKDHDSMRSIDYENEPLLKGKILKGSFIAFEDNLGVLKIRFTSYNRRNVDRVQFRFREKGSADWFVNNSFLTQNISGDLLYPFGFPVISDSKGKTYEFEIESENGTMENAIGIERGNQTLVSEYSYPKGALMKNPESLKKFIFTKCKTLSSNIYFLLFFSIFIIPAFFIFLKNKLPTRAQQTVAQFSYLLYSVVIYSYLPINLNSDSFVFIILYFHFIFYMVFPTTISSFLIYILGIMNIIQILGVILLSGNELILSKLGISTFFLFVLSVILSMGEIRIKRKRNKLQV